MPNANLSKAKSAKNDEFYTQYTDIQREVNAYLEYDADVFRGKTVLLPCDDPEWSNFTKFFAQNFEQFGLKKLISTSYAIDAKRSKYGELFDFAEGDDTARGKIFVLDHDTNKNGRIDIEDLEWHYLEGDGDFRSDEVKKLRDEADIIVTNPPFSLFREFLAWIISGNKRFLVIANKNCITYKEVFPLIMGNQIWTGATSMGCDLLFFVPVEIEQEMLAETKQGSKYRIIDGRFFARSASVWFTNLDHGRRHRPLQLMTMADNIKFSKHKEIRGHGYLRYVNFDAIEVPFTDAIPSDYRGAMGVPVSFLDKYCPEQFEILGQSLTLADMGTIRKILGRSDGGPRFYTPCADGIHREYDRILIRAKGMK